MRPPPLLLEFLSLVRQQTGASAATMLLQMEPVERQSMLLITDGADTIVPELADEQRAWQLIHDHREHAGNSSPVTVLPSTLEGGVLIRVALNNIMARPKSHRRAVNERRSQPEITTAPSIDGAIWFGLSDCVDARAFSVSLEHTAKPVPGGHEAEPRDWMTLFRALGVKFAWSVYQLTGSLQDPISQLPGRMEFQVFLKRAMAAAPLREQAVSLLLINPDDFSMINHRYGREQGDLAVREIADELARCLRQTDGVFRYGGAVFGVVLPATDQNQCKAAAEKVRRHLVQRKYIGDAEHLTFSMGAAVASPKDFATPGLEAADMLRQADIALNSAKMSGGAHIVVMSMDEHHRDGTQMSPLSGVFTADTEKDYRNMLLLWETVELVSANAEPSDMACAFIDRLALGFQPDRIALYAIGDDGELTDIATNVRDDAAAEGRASGRRVDLDETRKSLIDRALSSGQVERHHAEKTGARTAFTAYAVPLRARDSNIGCLYLDGRGRRLQLDSSDVIFLNALATQIATALDRAQLARRWIRGKDRESRQLREELQELRQSLNQTTMIYESDEMRALMDTLKRVAPSDATVLIIGESGTGKEMLAQSLHDFSERTDGPFVVFDCGAVAHSLIEAELFGHVKGAFTGAESASVGCIAQADGGTIFLDEIGELPLQVQAKLLRFVQEKEVSPVGSPLIRRVDVRIVAATNRKLQDEVATGSFRADLYYRLQVISLQALPLRHRRNDIQPLATFFLDKFSAQHGVGLKRFTAGALDRLANYDWPGNVRELQHCVLRAVLTADGESIDTTDIELLPESRPAALSNSAAQGPPPPSTISSGFEVPYGSPTTPAEPLTRISQPEEDIAKDPWQALREALASQIDRALQHNGAHPVPIGRWLTEDLVVAASEASNNVARRAASLVGVPESTFRRHHQKASAELDAGLANRTSGWEGVRPLIDQLVIAEQTNKSPGGRDLIEYCRVRLLEDVDRRVDGRVSVGAALMGVTPPTYKRWLEARAVQ